MYLAEIGFGGSKRRQTLSKPGTNVPRARALPKELTDILCGLAGGSGALVGDVVTDLYFLYCEHP